MSKKTNQTASPLATKLIVILGASYAGISTAHHLLKHTLPALADVSPAGTTHKVVLVGPSDSVVCRPACPRALVSDDKFDQAKLFVPIRDLFAQYPTTNFEFIKGVATRLDHEGRKVSVRLESAAGGKAGAETKTLDFHALVIATGASAASPLLGLNGDAGRLKEAWASFRTVLPKARRIVIGGGGPAGVETAGELADYYRSRQGDANSEKVEITIITSGKQILPSLRPAIAQTAEKNLASLGVTVLKGTRVEGVERPAGNAGKDLDVASPASIKLANGTILEADLYIPATGLRPNTDFVDASLLLPDGRVDTKVSTFRVSKAGPRIYAMGDVVPFANNAIHVYLAAVPVLGANMKRDLLAAEPSSSGLEKTGADRIFVEDVRETQIVPLGENKTLGVGAAMGYRLPGFVVWMAKGRDYMLWTTPRLWSGKQWSKEG